MNLIMIAMILALLIPIYEAFQDEDIWQKMLAFASIATKVFHHDPGGFCIAGRLDDWGGGGTYSQRR